ncbi:hypothetical protein VTJ49DRAFT_7553 [Mycothermus thermophilus]|uniref:Uncharacterized protein n=1 Tax=Humicola insolens TaxID=85995 RepID=A0ABR3VGL1_HUMIN
MKHLTHPSSTPPSIHRPLPILIQFRIPPLLRLRLLRLLLHRRLHLCLNSLSCAQDLALQVKRPALLGIIIIKQPLEPLHDLLHIGLAVLRRLDVEDLAGFFERHARAEAGAARGAIAVARLRALVLARGGGLLVGLGEGAADYARADDDDLGYEAVGLEEGVLVEEDISGGAVVHPVEGCCFAFAPLRMLTILSSVQSPMPL